MSRDNAEMFSFAEGPVSMGEAFVSQGASSDFTQAATAAVQEVRGAAAMSQANGMLANLGVSPASAEASNSSLPMTGGQELGVSA